MAPPRKKTKVMCKFRNDFTSEFKSIVTSDKGLHHAYCSLCRCDFLILHGGRNDMVNHLSMKKHAEASSSMKSAPISFFFVKNSEEEALRQLITTAELLFIMFLIEHNLPIAIADHCAALFKRMFPDSKIAAAFSCARTKASALTRCMAGHFSSELIDVLREQPFSLATDGSNDGGSSQIYPLVVRFFDKMKGAVVTQLLAVEECIGNSTGENIFKMIDATFTRMKIPWRNVTSFCCDIASVMMGVHKGVVKFIRDRNPSIVVNGCVCHLLHLAAKAGSKELHKDIKVVLVDIYHFLDKSCKRQKEFIQFQMECGVNLNKILKHGATRWLSLHSCIARLLEQWEPLYKYFNSEFELIPEAHKNSSKYERIRRVTKFLNNPVSRLYCLLLRDALPTFTNCNLAMQRDAPQIHIMKQRLEDIITDLLVKFVKTSAIAKCGDIFQLEFGLRKNQVPRDELKIGGEARIFLTSLQQEGKISRSDEDDFIKDVRNFFSASLAYIVAKFPLNDDVLEHARIFNVNKRGAALEKSLIFFNERFAVHPTEKHEALLLELSKYKLEPLPEELMSEDVDKQWNFIDKISNLDGHRKFTLLSSLAQTVLTIPHSNASSERIFSMVRKNHTMFRSAMSTETLSALMLIKIVMLAKNWQCFKSEFDGALLKKAKSATSVLLKK